MSNVDQWVSAEFERLAQIINDYDEYLFLEMVPVADQQHLTDKSKVFRVVDDKIKKVIFHFDSLANPAQILTEIFNMDSRKGDVVAKLDAHNAAIEALNNQVKIDKAMAVKDFTEFVFRNEKNVWHHAGVKRDSEFRDLGPTKKIIL